MATTKRVFHCIAAMDSKRGIGKNNNLPWRLPKEYKYFSDVTKHVNSPDKQNAVILGRNTWFSIPEKFRPLPRRLNIVLSRSMNAEDFPENVKLVKSLDEAIDLLCHEQFISSIENIFIIGGQSVYKEAMGMTECEKIYMTKVEGDFECDVFYPEFDESIYKEIALDSVPQDIQEEKGIKYTFHVYSREPTIEE